MSDKRIQDLTPASSVGLADRFVLEQSGQAKSLTGQVLIADLASALDGHGGISGVSYTPPVAPSLDGTLAITLADNTSYDVTITNGNGISSVAVAYGISTSGTDPLLVTEWSNTVVAPTDANPYMWTKITLAYIDGGSTVAYSVTAKAEDPSISVGSVSAYSGAAASVSITNSGTPLDAILDFDFTLPKGDKGDTGDYIDPVVSYGTSTASATEPSTWYSSPSSISYAAGNYIWRKTDYTLHDAQTVQSTKKEIIGYIGQNGSGSGTVTQITFNGDVFSDDGTGNVPMTVDAEDVGAIADPSTKSDGQVLTWDSNANAWVAANPATGNVNTVNNVGVTAGTTNIDITGANIPVSGSDNTPISDALGAIVPIGKGGTAGQSANEANNNLQNYNLLDAISIGTNSNLNSLTTPNVYRSNGDAMTASLTGKPADLTHGFKMIVMAILSTSYIMQHIHEWDTGNEWKRYGSVSNDVWTFGSWVKVAVASPLAGSNFTAIEDSFTVSFSAGTIGTRAQQFMLGRTIPSGMKIMSAVVTAIDASDKYLPVAFAHNNNLYLNIYRATDQAVSDKSVSVRYVLTDIF